MSHVFISYVRENEALAIQLSRILRENGVDVWLDRDSIAPGKRWKHEIRRAIHDGAFFVACFSAEYSAKTKTYMNEELTIAIEELRLRPAERSWFIPVKLSDCGIPDRDIGAGGTLLDIQWLDLSRDWSEGCKELANLLLSDDAPAGPWRPPAKRSAIFETSVRLSDAARELLFEGTRDEAGIIARSHTFGGVSITTHGREFIEEQSPRTIAKWDGALDSLTEEGLVVDKKGKGQIFWVTDRGFEAADAIASGG